VRATPVPAEPEFLRCARAFEDECDYVHRALRRHGVRRQDAADLVQEVFLVMWRRWPQFDRGRPLRPWLAGIAFKVAHAHHRRFCRREIPSDGVDPAADAPAPDEQLARARARSVALSALEHLPEKYRSVLVLHDIDGLPVEEIAALAEAPRFTIHTRLRRARLRFEKAVEALEAAPPERRRAGFLGAGALLALERRSSAAPAEVRARFRAQLPALARAPWPGPPPPAVPRWRWPVAGTVVAAALVAAVSIRSSDRAVAPAPAPVRAAPGRSLTARRTAPALAGRPASLPAPAAPALALDAGLVGRWSFDEAAGTVARDLSGQGHDCALRSIDPEKAWQAGQLGGAVRLGPHGWLECPQPTTVGRGPVAMTLALWVKRDGSGATSTLVDRALGPGPESVFHFALAGNKLKLWSGLWSHNTIYELEAPLSGWVHLAFTHGGRTTKIFVDGTLVAQRDDTRMKAPGVVTTAPLVVGALVKDPARVWQRLGGAVDELRLYDRALSDAEIEALASAGR
jgi:RNA polymerase sigma factor (sigma-70 family)